MKLIDKASIKTKLIILVLGILLLVVGGGLYSSQRISNFSENLLKDTYAQNAKTLNSSIATLFFERYGDVQAFAVNQAVISMNETVMTEYLNRYVTLYGIYDLILVVDKAGKFVASNDQDVAGKVVNKNNLREQDFSQTPWFQAAMAEKFTEDRKKGFVGSYVEDFIYDPLQKMAFDEERTASSFTTLIKNSAGEVLGVITNRAGSRWYEGEMIKLYDNLKNQGLISSEIVVMNKNGFIISEYDPATQGGAIHVRHNPEITLKLNLLDQKQPAALLAHEQKSGSMITEHTRKKIQQITGYDFNNDPKFISSLGWSTLVRESTDIAFASQNQTIKTTYSILILITILALLGSVWFSNNLSGSITQITEQVAAASSMVTSASEQLSRSSAELSNTAQKQASSIEETSSSLEEIAGMIDANVKSAENANNISLEVKKFTNETQKSISDLSHAMSEILDSNNRIEKLVRIIEEIGEKTEIIDEIVFKTQLLSFNASVEAERAGEHGRGFAVVAQEVGGLAQVSGKAAAAISNIVKDSIKEAEAVAVQNKERVETGGELVLQTQEKMNHVLEKMNTIYESTNQIVTASREQAIGINQITNSVDSLSLATQQNASTAEESANSSTELSTQADRLMDLVNQMKELVMGKQSQAQEEKNIVAFNPHAPWTAENRPRRRRHY